MEGPRCREARDQGVSSGRRRGRVRDEGAEGEEVARVRGSRSNRWETLED